MENYQGGQCRAIETSENVILRVRPKSLDTASPVPPSLHHSLNQYHPTPPAPAPHSLRLSTNIYCHISADYFRITLSPSSPLTFLTLDKWNHPPRFTNNSTTLTNFGGDTTPARYVESIAQEDRSSEWLRLRSYQWRCGLAFQRQVQEVDQKDEFE